MIPQPPDPPRTVLRALHERFVAAWAARRPPASGEEAAAAYVDVFAGGDASRPPGAAGGGMPAAALVATLPAGTGALLLEEDPVRAGWLRDALARAGQARRLGGAAAGPLGRGEVRVAETGPGPDGAREALSLAARRLVSLVPPAPGRLPLDGLDGWLADEGADVLVGFPAEGLRLLARHRASTFADLPPVARRAADGYSTLFGDPRQGWFLAWRAALAAGDAAAAERVLAERYAAALAARHPERIVKLVIADGPSRDAAPACLVLVSADPALALLLNEVVYAARRAGEAAWPPEDGTEVVTHRPTGVLDLFGVPAAGRGEEGPRERCVDPLRVAHLLATRYAGRTLPYGRLLADHAGTELFAGDLRRALAELRRDGRALFAALEPGSPVAFPRAVRARGPRPAPRRGRRAGAGSPTLPLENEGRRSTSPSERSPTA